MNKKKSILTFISIFLIGIFSIFALIGVGVPDEIVSENNVVQQFGYTGHVDIYKNGKLWDSVDNIQYNIGKNMTREILGAGQTGIPNLIGLCNASEVCNEPAVDDAVAENLFASCGLNNATGTYTELVGAGNWTQTVTFTSGGACGVLETNVTFLMNQSGTVFAGVSFTLAQLDSSSADQLTINWSLTNT